MRKLIVGFMCALAMIVSVVIVDTPIGSAETRAGFGIESVHGFVHGGQEIWQQVNPFSGLKGFTKEGEGILATCKHWGSDQRWWYWVKFDSDGLTGHVPGNQTNITHSHLQVCGS